MWSLGAYSPILVQPEVGTEVNALHILVLRQTLGRPALENHAVMDDVRAIRNPGGLADVVVRDEDADPLRLQVEDDLLDVRDGNRVDAGEGLVEQHELGGDDQRPRDLD